MKFARLYLKPYGQVFYDYPIPDEFNMNHAMHMAQRDKALVTADFAIPVESIHYMLMITANEPKTLNEPVNQQGVIYSLKN